MKNMKIVAITLFSGFLGGITGSALGVFARDADVTAAWSVLAASGMLCGNVTPASSVVPPAFGLMGAILYSIVGACVAVSVFRSPRSSHGVVGGPHEPDVEQPHDATSREHA